MTPSPQQHQRRVRRRRIHTPLHRQSVSQLLRSLSVSAATVCVLVLLAATTTITTTTRLSAAAFVPQYSTTTTSSTTTATTTTRTPTTQLWAAIPQIDQWQVLRSGAVKGTITKHPELPDGYEITTSPLDDKYKSNPRDNSVVTTASGSKYKLLTQKNNNNNNNRATLSMFGNSKTENPANKKTKPKPAVAKAKKPLAAPKQAAKPKPAFNKPSIVANQKKATTPKPAPAAAVAPKTNYNLNGKSVGNGSDVYLLVGNLVRSSSRRSQIYYAYKADSNGQPSGQKLIVKLTNSVERLTREDKNYNRVFSKGRVLFSLQGSGSCYVKKVAFCPDADASPFTKGVPKGNAALVLESGDANLRAYLKTNQGKPLTGTMLRRAAVSVARCVEAMHSSGLVWTDLKAENFVLIESSREVKGIDLESAVPVRSSPEDYSPEACPPEFAAAEKAGNGYDFEVLKNYDSWSLGMLFYELATGKNYFEGQSESAIFNLLAAAGTNNNNNKLIDPEDPETIRGLEAIPDDRFRDLTRSCLSINPKKRPSIEAVLLHPYFLTTGLGPLSF